MHLPQSRWYSRDEQRSLSDLALFDRPFFDRPLFHKSAFYRSVILGPLMPLEDRTLLRVSAEQRVVVEKGHLRTTARN